LPLLDTFLWNEAGDRWILLSPAVESAGGNVEVNQFFTIATANVYGTSVPFHLGTDVINVQGRGFAVRADVFYNAVVDAAGQLAFVGSHDVVIMGVNVNRGHTGIIMFSSNRSGFYSNSLFTYNIPPAFGSIRFATLGAGPERETLFGGIDGTLIAEANHSRDVGIVRGTSPNAKFIWVDANAEQIGNMVTFDKYFRDNSNGVLTYNGVPAVFGDYNSNSYAYSLLRHAGIARPNLPTSGRGSFPGWGELIPLTYFR
jgi:hypothetical protein